MGKPNYRVIVAFDRDRGVWAARTPELEHLTGDGATRAEAIGKLEEEIDAQLANMLSHGTQPPRAIDEVEHSGEVKAKVSKGLHRELAYLARSEGVELDQLLGELLASALTSRQGARGGGRQRPTQADLGDDSIGNRVDGGNQRRGGFPRGGGNSHVMDDRANFIEYVRGLEHNGNQRPGGHSHGGAQGHGGPRGGGGPGGGGGGGGNDSRRRRGGRGGQGPQGGGPGRDGNRMQGGQGPRPPQAHGGPPSQVPAPTHAPAPAHAPDSDRHEG